VAEAPGHRLGQIIGDALELAVEPMLRAFAAGHDLYLDKKQARPTREGVKCTWVDSLGNSHDLDFVLERGGSRTRVGTPAAFVETAWRRYTKHSRAKAQEIQGAILPLLGTHANVKPFAGAVVAGRWTSGALQQMRSSGLSVLHIDYDEIVEVFSTVGVDIDSHEDTPDSYLQTQVNQWLTLSGKQRATVGDGLRACAPERFAAFQDQLEQVILRRVERVTVLPLHGAEIECRGASEAIEAITAYRTPGESAGLVRIEVVVRYSNSDQIQAELRSASDAVDFLRSFDEAARSCPHLSEQ
jgi:hypothetical protein